jgi:prepilin-type N-terminal cleavage/methylation domain-containing protein
MRNTALSGRATRGFTMIELMITVAVIAIVLSVAAPSFTSFLAKKRVESTMAELSTDIQYARSESVSRNAAVRLTYVSSSCYAVHLSTDAASCTTTTNMIKTQSLTSGSTAALSAASNGYYIEFDPVRGLATFSDGNTPGAININSSNNAYQLRAAVCTMGRVVVCSPNTSFNGYPTCPTSC